MKAWSTTILLAAAVSAVPAVSSATSIKNFLLIAIDDLRPLFGRSYGQEEVLTPNLDRHFLDGNGSVMQNSYVQIAVCGPSRSSILTGRRPDTTQVGVQGGTMVQDWCWCQRTKCKKGELFMTLPTYLAQNGFATTGNGKIFHPDACTRMHQPDYGFDFSHKFGDDSRAWNYGTYGVEGELQKPYANAVEQNSEEQFGTIPGPFFKEFNFTTGLSWMRSPLKDEQQPDGQLATDAVQRLQNFTKSGIGGDSASQKPFFLAVGFHKPHLPHIVPEKYFQLYDNTTISLAPNTEVPKGFLEENWHADGTPEMVSYSNNDYAFNATAGRFGFNKPVGDDKARELRHGYFAATSFIDAQVGRVLDALEQYGFADNTAVALWSDHGWHLGDTNSWCKMTNFETGTRNTMMWRVPGQSAASQGRNTRLVEMLDFFPTVIDLLGLPKLDKCKGVDQPPTVECLQGDSYADEFTATGAESSNDDDDDSTSTEKEYAFSQWAYPVWDSPGASVFRMGYTVRSNDGYRYTVYVPYDWQDTYKGNWTQELGSELYDYNKDPHETINHAADAEYATVVQRLDSVLRQQYLNGTVY